MPLVLVALAATLVGCGDASDTTAGGGATTTEPRRYEGRFTSSDGNRYRITVALGAPGASPGPDQCAPPLAADQVSVPVTLTVANLSPDHPVPFPPLRLEMVYAGGRERVMVQDGSGCTFTPRVPQIEGGGEVEFRGSTPPVGAGAEPGTAGRVEVNISESSFSLAAPVP